MGDPALIRDLAARGGLRRACLAFQKCQPLDQLVQRALDAAERVHAALFRSILEILQIGQRPAEEVDFAMRIALRQGFQRIGNGGFGRAFRRLDGAFTHALDLVHQIVHRLVERARLGAGIAFALKALRDLGDLRFEGVDCLEAGIGLLGCIEPGGELIEHLLQRSDFTAQVDGAQILVDLVHALHQRLETDRGPGARRGHGRFEIALQLLELALEIRTFAVADTIDPGGELVQPGEHFRRYFRGGIAGLPGLIQLALECFDLARHGAEIGIRRAGGELVDLGVEAFELPDQHAEFRTAGLGQVLQVGRHCRDLARHCLGLRATQPSRELLEPSGHALDPLAE